MKRSALWIVPGLVLLAGLAGCGLEPWVKPYERDRLADALLHLDACTDMRGLLALTRPDPSAHLRAAGSDD